MTIKRKLLLLALLPIALAVATVLVITWGYRQVDAARETERVANEVVRTVFDLTLLVDEYLQHPDPRPVEQWRRRHDALRGLLGELEFAGAEERKLLARMEKTDEAALSLYTQLTAGGRPAEDRQGDAAAELQQRLAGQLSARLHEMAALAARVAAASSKEALRVRNLTNTLLIVMVALTAALQVGVSFLVRKGVAGPIARLLAATEAVGRGDFPQAVGTTAQDEIGELSRAFDAMTERLQRVTVSRDRLAAEVQARQAAEASLVQAKEAAEAASRAKSTFLANMSHEIRTPLNAIIGMTELVLKSQVSTQQREFLSTVRDSGEALLSVINDILDFSKIEAERLVLNPVPFDLRESLGDTMKSFALRAHQQGLELACCIHPDVPRMVVGDYNRLRQVIVNLVGNALKFTEAGEVVLEASVEASSPDDVLLHFIVSDTGIGIPEDKQAVIFEMFEQADNSTTRRHGGTGLGLAIASRLVGLMGGRICVESEVGRGSRFHFTVRLQRAAAEAAEPVAPEPACLHGMRVLVVDDNATNRRILDEILRSWRMVPAAARGADEALELLRQAQAVGEPYRLVLTDAHMPGADGFTLAEKIRGDAVLGSTVVMMLTSGDRPDDTVRCDQLGIVAYLLKPIKQSELLEAIDLALGISDTHRELAGGTRRRGRVGALRVLLAEDSLVNQKLAVALLESEGHAVTVARNGREALAAFEAQPFDVVLMDVQMPEMDGLEATLAIRAKEKQTGAHIPIVAMTARALAGDRQRCLEAGMDGYVAKPIRAAELFEMIDALCGPQGSGGAASAPPAEQEAVNWSEALAAVRGDHALLRTIVEAAAEELPRLLEAVSKGIASGDAKVTRLAAHTLRGSIRYFGAAAATQLAGQVEALAAEGDLATASTLLPRLEEEIRRLSASLSAYLQGSV